MTQKRPSNFLKGFKKRINIMEVCGTHTVSISRSGIRSIIPSNIRLISGPGCPVCVTPQSDIDRFIELSKDKGTIIATFGDMIRVPGSSSSLEKEISKGAKVEIVYSPLDCLDIAAMNPGKEVVFIGVGFETTSPTVAGAVLEAKKRKIKNFSVISAFKLIPPALKVLTEAEDIKIDGFLLPGHVSAIIGTGPYEFIKIPGVVTGFGPGDILEALEMIIGMIGADGRQPMQNIAIQYRSVVHPEGNPAALKVLYEVFEAADSQWRALGTIADSGLRIRKEYSEYDADKKFKMTKRTAKEPKGCDCGSIIKGIKIPTECRLFGKVCTPENPVGPCMVSSEGACSAYYRYSAEALKR